MVPILVLCGQAGVGKDTLGTYLSYNHGATCIALADPIKRICQYVFEFTDEQLWGPSKFRGEIDKRYAGIESQELLRTKINAKLNLITGSYPEIPNMHLFKGRLRDHLFDCRAKALEGLTPRYCLQTLGTEFGRSTDPNIWVKIALDTATKLLEDPTLTYVPSKGIQKRNPGTREWKTGGIVITDGRFRNEILEVKKIGGIAVGLRRTGLPQAPKTHQSETELEEIPLQWFDYLLWNNRDIRDLDTKADALISKVWHQGETI